MHPRILQENIVEKVLRDKNGRLARVTFHIYEDAGNLKARVLTVDYLEEVKEEIVLKLSGEIITNDVKPLVSESFSIVSPFVDDSFIFKIGIKPRAPTSK